MMTAMNIHKRTSDSIQIKRFLTRAKLDRTEELKAVQQFSNNFNIQIKHFTRHKQTKNRKCRLKKEITIM